MKSWLWRRSGSFLDIWQVKRNVGFRSSYVMSYCTWHMGGVSTPWGGLVWWCVGLKDNVAWGKGFGAGTEPGAGNPQLGPGSPRASRLGAVAPSLNREKLPGEQLKLFSIQLFPVQGAARW